MFAWFFLSALYLQLVLGYSPLQVGLAFLPANLLMGGFSIGVSAKLVMRFGIRPPLIAGMIFWTASASSCSPARRSTAASWWTCCRHARARRRRRHRLQPGAAGGHERRRAAEAGLASGVVNTSFMMGGALGLAVLASLAAYRTSSLRDGGASEAAALTGGYHAAFLVGAIFTIMAALLATFVLRPMAMGAPAAEPESAHGREPEASPQRASPARLRDHLAVDDGVGEQPLERLAHVRLGGPVESELDGDVVIGGDGDLGPGVGVTSPITERASSAKPSFSPDAPTAVPVTLMCTFVIDSSLSVDTSEADGKRVRPTSRAGLDVIAWSFAQIGCAA